MSETPRVFPETARSPKKRGRPRSFASQLPPSKPHTIEPQTLVRFNFDGMSKEEAEQYPFKPKDHFLFLGEIKQMEGHCSLIRMSDGKFFGGYHTDNFVVLTEDEL